MTEWQPIETAPRQKILLCFAVTDVAENGEVFSAQRKDRIMG